MDCYCLDIDGFRLGHCPSWRSRENQNDTRLAADDERCPIFVAESEDLFSKEGLDVNLIKFTAGPPFFAAFQSRSIDVGFMGLQPAVTAVAQGVPVKIVAAENDAFGAEGLVARDDSGIKMLTDLRGKKVATKRGSSAHTALLTGLQIAGLKEGDIQLVDLDVTALLPAFRKGDIQAAWYWEPWMGLLKRENGRVVATDGGYQIAFRYRLGRERKLA